MGPPSACGHFPRVFDLNASSAASSFDGCSCSGSETGGPGSAAGCWLTCSRRHRPPSSATCRSPPPLTAGTRLSPTAQPVRQPLSARLSVTSSGPTPSPAMRRGRRSAAPFCSSAHEPALNTGGPAGMATGACRDMRQKHCRPGHWTRGANRAGAAPETSRSGDARTLEAWLGLFGGLGRRQAARSLMPFTPFCLAQCAQQ